MKSKNRPLKQLQMNSLLGFQPNVDCTNLEENTTQLYLDSCGSGEGGSVIHPDVPLKNQYEALSHSDIETTLINDGIFDQRLKVRAPQRQETLWL